MRRCPPTLTVRTTSPARRGRPATTACPSSAGPWCVGSTLTNSSTPRRASWPRAPPCPYADTREQQAPTPDYVLDRSEGPGALARLRLRPGRRVELHLHGRQPAGQPELELGSGHRVHRTRRGRILCPGGDRVCPVPTRREYENRFLGPHRSALPCPPAEGARELVAIPGSHDWYDGLVNLASLFCRRRRIGGWQTRQKRSCFAAQLPHRWWLWGIDLQFGDNVDEAQVAYFRSAAADLHRGERVIVCLAREVEMGASGCSEAQGGVLGVSGYLWFTICWGLHANEAYAPLHQLQPEVLPSPPHRRRRRPHRLPGGHRTGRAPLAVPARGRAGRLPARSRRGPGPAGPPDRAAARDLRRRPD